MGKVEKCCARKREKLNEFSLQSWTSSWNLERMQQCCWGRMEMIWFYMNVIINFPPTRSRMQKAKASSLLLYHLRSHLSLCSSSTHDTNFRDSACVCSLCVRALFPNIAYNLYNLLSYALAIGAGDLLSISSNLHTHTFNIHISIFRSERGEKWEIWIIYSMIFRRKFHFRYGVKCRCSR